MLPISFIVTDVKRNQKGSAMKKIIGVLSVGMSILLIGCGPSAQEKALQAAQERQNGVAGA